MAVTGVGIRFSTSGKCADRELYERALDMLKQLVPERFELPYAHKVVYEEFPGCLFPPRAVVYVDVSRLLREHEELYYPCAYTSLYFDRQGRPVVHVYKRFSIVYGGEAEDIFREELLAALREVIEKSVDYRVTGSVFSMKDKVQLEVWLIGDEVCETKKMLQKLVNTVLYVVQRCPWVVIAHEYRAVLARLLALCDVLEVDSAEMFHEPDYDILLRIDVDKLSEGAKNILATLIQVEKTLQSQL
jgi:hypothetical protein